MRERAAAEAPVLGICVGEQVLFEEGIEHGVRTRGVGVFEGRVDLLEARRIPHMGWNTVEAAEGMRLFAGIDPAERFYFVHSYAAKAVPPGALAAICTHESRSSPPWSAAPWPPPSSTPRSPATPGTRCCPTGSRPLLLERHDMTQLQLLPAVDVTGGKAVQLVQGVAGSGKQYGDPIEAALEWQRQGSQWLHLVDLDAAFGRGSNHGLLAEVVSKVDMQVEISGGIRDDETLKRALDSGAAASTSAPPPSRTPSGATASAANTATASPSAWT